MSEEILEATLTRTQEECTRLLLENRRLTIENAVLKDLLYEYDIRLEDE